MSTTTDPDGGLGVVVEGMNLMDDSQTDQRGEAVAWATAARDKRHRCRVALRNGSMGLDDVLEQGVADELIARLTLLWVLESLPDAGKVATRRRLAELGLDGSMMLRDLDAEALATVRREFGPGPEGSGGEQDDD